MQAKEAREVLGWSILTFDGHMENWTGKKKWANAAKKKGLKVGNVVRARKKQNDY